MKSLNETALDIADQLGASSGQYRDELRQAILTALQQREQEREAQVASLTKERDAAQTAERRWKTEAAISETNLGIAREDVKRPQRKHLVESAGYWYRASHSKGYNESAMAMEQAYNHTENALYAVTAECDQLKAENEKLRATVAAKDGALERALYIVRSRNVYPEDEKLITSALSPEIANEFVRREALQYAFDILGRCREVFESKCEGQHSWPRNEILDALSRAETELKGKQP